MPQGFSGATSSAHRGLSGVGDGRGDRGVRGVGSHRDSRVSNGFDMIALASLSQRGLTAGFVIWWMGVRAGTIGIGGGPGTKLELGCRCTPCPAILFAILPPCFCSVSCAQCVSCLTRKAPLNRACAHWRGGRVAEGGGLLIRLRPYQPVMTCSAQHCFV